MKFVRIAAIMASSAVSAFGSGNGHGGGSSSAAPAGHHSSSAPAAATTSAGPHSSGGSMPRSMHSGQMPYRATVTYHNGNKTLIYPAVRGSTVQRSTNSNLSSANNNTRSLRHSGSGNLQTNAANLSRNSTNFQRGVVTSQQGGGNLRNGANSQHPAAINLHAKNRLDPQSSARLRQWSGNVSSSGQAHQNHWNNCHHHHNHDWWHNHCAAFIFWGWGWWGWYDGWWYPAWGYDSYSYYGYNEPIYGYGDLSPEQIVASVQVALQEQGYYQYSIDDQMGPMTKEAIARYQRDHRLPITYGIDPATLGSLGIIH